MKFIKEEILTLPTNGGIYLFTNTLNNKCYVGQAISLRKRLLAHLGNFTNKRYNNPLYRALEKHGTEVFTISILEVIEETYDKKVLRKLLDDLEVKYIEQYNSYNSGYNQTKGGDGGILGYKMTDEQKQKISENSSKQMADGRYLVYCKNLETNEILQFMNMVELSAKMEFNVVAARTAKSKKRIYNGKYYFANTLEEVQNVEINDIYKARLNNKYNPYNENNQYLVDYYNFLITVENPTIEKLSYLLNLSKDTISKRHRKLKDLGYKLPIDKKRIKSILIENIKTNEKLELSLEESTKFFNIKEKSLIKQARRDGVYKKCYILKLVYED